MKIAIQGHPVRWKEVIQILKNLGGNDTYVTFGYNPNSYYYINVNNNITYIPTSKLKCSEYKDFKLYTLEEFEKEFPFKVGDKVIHKEFNDFFEVISFNPESSYPYKIKGVCEFSTKSYILTKWQPKMKEERFVTLTLNKAKEWYKKGGELKEIALQAFSEKELNPPFPRSWEEFCKRGNPIASWRYAIPTKYEALYKLKQLRDCWRQGWKPTNDDTGYCIIHYPTEYTIMAFCFISFLSFPTREIAEEFLKCFRDLIEKAGDLI